jgi:hypothetical protein
MKQQRFARKILDEVLSTAFRVLDRETAAVFWRSSKANWVDGYVEAIVIDQLAVDVALAKCRLKTD